MRHPIWGGAGYVALGSNCETLRRSMVIPSFPWQRTLIRDGSMPAFKATVTLENYRRGRSI